MLDVHILVSKDTRKDWIDQSIKSVEAAIKLADYPINLFVLPGVRGHIGLARSKGFSLGSAPWKTYVDDDDYVLPTAFTDVGKYLDQDIAGIFTAEHVEQNGKLHSFVQQDHHLQVYRKDITEVGNYDLACMSDVWLHELVKRDPRGFVSAPEVTYVHRVYFKSKARVLRQENPQERHTLLEKFR